MILQLVLTHSYDDVKIVLLADVETADQFSFVRYLPHCWDNGHTIRFYVSNPSDALKVGEYLSRETEAVLSASGRGDALRRNPAYVVFALDKGLFDRVEVFKEVMFQQDYCGIAIVAAFEGVPKDCKKLIELRSDTKLVDLVQMDADDVPFSLDRFDTETARESIRELMRTKLLVGSEAFALPELVTFFQMHDAGTLEKLDVQENWDWKTDEPRRDPFKSLAAPIGIGTDGQLFYLDLHEKAHGPHGLVAGTTGSGKSEFLMTFILSMAILYSPELVSFALIDYKGGGLTDSFAFAEEQEEGGTKEKRVYRLPHLAGTITNLDGASIQRSIMSIESEIKRREALFQEAKTLSSGDAKIEIYEYQRLYRDGIVSTPLPHLFIIADEFAELRSKEPAFMDTLISITRVGRSLGMHLILATQKPGGIVSPEMWSNMKTHVCLRVQERTDSMDMLRRPEATDLRQSGRFYLQVGNNEYFAMGQSAWCGADYFPQEDVTGRRDETVQFLDNAGQVILSKKRVRNLGKAKEKQLVAVVKYLDALGESKKLRSPKLWADPLPVRIPLEPLLDYAEAERQSGRNLSGGAGKADASHPHGGTEEPWEKDWPSVKRMMPLDAFKMPVLLGMVDDPEHQSQYPFYLDLLSFYNLLLVGNTGSGKSGFLRTLLYSLMRSYSPEEVSYYIIDLSNEALSQYRNTRHCGAYLTEKNESDINRFFSFVREMISERKQLYSAFTSETGIMDFASFQALRRIPVMLIIVDGYMNLSALQNGSAHQSVFHEYLREGTNFGIRYILTCNHVNEVSLRAKQELDLKIALRLKDRYEYGELLNTRCTFEPEPVPGRGMFLQGKRPLTYQACLLEGDTGELLARASMRYEGQKRARLFPMPDMDQSYEEFCGEFPTTGRIPLGYSRKTMKPVAIPFQQLHSASVYFGNPAGIQPIFQNLISAAQWNNMELLIFKRKLNSVFEEGAAKPIRLPDGAELYPCTKEGFTNLVYRVNDAAHKRMELGVEYCRKQGLPDNYQGKMLRAAKYIRQNTPGILVLIERMEDFFQVAGTEPVKEGEVDLNRGFSGILAKRAYHIYYIFGLYPNDTESILSSHPIWETYQKDKLGMGKIDLLFGGHFDRAAIPDLPYEDKNKYTKLLPKYNRFLLRYQGESHGMIMPCGNLEDVQVDPDELPII